MNKSLFALALAIVAAAAGYVLLKPAKMEKEAAELTVVAAGPMTGSRALFGEQMKRGVEMAVADVNAAGGVLGRNLKLIIEDDACDPKQAVTVANKAAGEDADLVVGHYCSGSSIPASKVYTEEGIIQISPGSTNPKLTDEGGDNVFRVCGRDDQQGMVIANYIAQNFKGMRIAILHDKTTYGKGLADEVRKQLGEYGVKEALYEAYTVGEKDYSALVSRLKEKAIEVVHIGGYHTEIGLIARHAREQGYKPILIAGDSVATREYWNITGPAGEGTLMTFNPDPRKNPIAKPLVERFRKSGYEPETYTLYSYAAVQAWVQAVKNAGSVDVDKVIAALREGEFNTALGTISFDDNGDVLAPGFVVYEWKDGDYDYVQ